MKKILVAVDGSIPAIHAAKKGLELAKPFNAAVTLVHVTPPTVWPGDAALAPVTDMREAELAHGASILKAVSSALEGAKVATMNLLGPPAEVIADIAIDEDYDSRYSVEGTGGYGSSGAGPLTWNADYSSRVQRA